MSPLNLYVMKILSNPDLTSVGLKWSFYKSNKILPSLSISSSLFLQRWRKYKRLKQLRVLETP